MPYTRPSSLATGATWSGSVAYTRPSPAAVGVQWSESGSTIYPADGWKATQFGTPSRAETVTASGWLSTLFGSAWGANAFPAASVGRLTRFGTPATPTFLQPQASGWQSPKFGTPYGIAPFAFEPENLVTPASGWKSVVFGVHSASVHFAGQSQGWQSPQFAAPKFTASGGAVTVGLLASFGQPIGGAAGRVAGWQAAQFGTPIIAAGYLAQGFSRTKFGAPRSQVPGALLVRGWCGTRMGTPLGRILPQGYAATGFGGLQFGLAATFVRHKASTMASPTRYGRPILRRNPTC